MAAAASTPRADTARRSRRASTGSDVITVWDCLNTAEEAVSLPANVNNADEAGIYIGKPALLETASPATGTKSKKVFKKRLLNCCLCVVSCLIYGWL